MEQETSSPDLRQGQVVWAKVVGYPWWPGVIASITPDTPKGILVNFLNHCSHAKLSRSKVIDFQSNRDTYLTRRGRKLVQAYHAACRICDGQTTFEEERQQTRDNTKNNSHTNSTYDGPGQLEQPGQFKDGLLKASGARKSRARIRGNLRFVPEVPLSETQERQPRSRSKHKSRRSRRNRLVVASEKSSQDSESNSLQKVSELGSMFSTEDTSDKGVDTKDLDFSSYLETLVNKLSMIRSGHYDFSKEVTYAELLRLVGNCERLNLDFDLLIGSKLGKYLHLAYVILLEINDTESLGYQRLLPRLSKIRKLCKERILSFFSTERNVIQDNDKNDIKSGRSLSFKSTKEKISFLMLNFERALDIDSAREKAQMVSLVEKGMDKLPMRTPVSSAQKQNPNKPKFLRPQSGLVSKSRRKPFQKEEHIIKQVILSRTASPCPSSRSSNFSLNSSYSKQKKSPNHIGTIKQLGNCAFSSANSLDRAISQCSASNLSQDSFASIKPIDNFGGRPFTSTGPKILVKQEEGGLMAGLRKRVCRKVYSILYKEFKRPKNFSKSITLALEYRINVLYPHKSTKYMKTVKNLFKKLRRREISIEELTSLSKKPLDTFKGYLEAKEVIKA